MVQTMAIQDVAGATAPETPSCGAVVAVTNAQADTSRRGLAIALAEHLARATRRGVGILEADHADRDVLRRLPALREKWGPPCSVRLSRGAHVIEIDLFESTHLCLVSATSPGDLPEALLHLQSVFDLVVVDAPSRLATGHSNRWLRNLDTVVITTYATADALAGTRRFVDRVLSMPYTRELDVQVIVIGPDPIGRRSRAQTDRRVASLRPIARIPALWGAGADQNPVELTAGLDTLTAYVLAQSRRAQHSA
jgi:hypothetical protein